MINELETESKLESYLMTLEARDDITDFKFTISEEFKQKYHLKVGAAFVFLVNGNGFDLSVGLDTDFPYSMPHIFLNKKLYGIYPHVEDNGWVCYFRRQGTVVDAQRPKDILSNALDLVKDRIIGLSDSEIRVEITNEFEAYLNRVEEIKHIRSYLTIGNELKEIIFVDGKENFICEFESQVDSFYNQKVKRNFRVRNAIYLPLDSQNVEPPLDKFWSLDEIKELIHRNLKKESWESLNKLLKKRKLGNKEFLLISIPRHDKENILIGIDFHNTENEYPILENGFAHKLFPYRIHRLDSNFLLNRGGVSTKLEEKKILLIGLGSIGGFIAEGLADIGVRKMTFIDNDRLEYGNIYRHLLGRDYVLKKKSVAVKSYLESSYPYLELVPHDSEVISLIKAGEVDLKKFDMVVVALGNPISEMHLNKIFKKLEIPKIIYTWLEPLDIGGHVLTLNYTLYGCYNCLYDSELYNRASFLAAGQDFERDMEGCGTSFSPYGVVSAKKTANLVIESVSQIFRNDNFEPMILSWKGKSDQIHENGYEVSKRYYLSDEELKSGGKHFVQKNCEVCGE